MQINFLRLLGKCLLLTPVLSFLLFAAQCHAATLADFPFREGVIHVCRIDLRQESIRMFWKDDQGKIFGNFDQLNIWLRSRKETLVCATNGGIYEEDLRPLGLYVEEGRILRRLNQRKHAYGNFYLEPRGVFLIQGQQGAGPVSGGEYDIHPVNRRHHRGDPSEQPTYLKVTSVRVFF